MSFWRRTNRTSYARLFLQDSGVKIYILAYKESRLALGINSWYSKKKLMKMSPNIIVRSFFVASLSSKHFNAIGQQCLNIALPKFQCLTWELCRTLRFQ